MNKTFDVAVVGLGAMGAHAVLELARRGCRTIGIERFGPLHDRGSSHGDTRLIRMAYYEGREYVPLLRRAYARWREIEQQSGEALLTITGLLHLGPPQGALICGVRNSSREYGLAVEEVSADEIRRRFPAFNPGETQVGVFEPEGGFLRPERAITAATKLAGAESAAPLLRYNERVVKIAPAAASGGGLVIETDLGETYHAGKVVVAAGSYVAGLVPSLVGIARPLRQVVGWYQSRNALATDLGRMPGFLVEEEDGSMYFGFPNLGEGVKLGKHRHLGGTIDPEPPNAPVEEADRAPGRVFAASRLPALVPEATRSITCRYTMLPGEQFLLDFDPENADIIVASPCSGHGFKFASVVGEVLASLSTEAKAPAGLDLAPFTFAALQQRLAAKPD